MKYKVEIMAGSSPEWIGNDLRFDDVDSAISYARDLYQRWAAVIAWRVVDDGGNGHAMGVSPEAAACVWPVARSRNEVVN